MGGVFQPDDVLVEAYCAVLHGWCSALQGLLGRQGDVHHSLLLSPAVAGLWAVFLKRREMVGPIQWQAQTRKRREGNAGVQRLINILKKSSVSSPGSRLHHATHRHSAAAGKNTPTSAFPKTTNTIDTRKGKRCFERAALASHDKNSRAAAGWQAACELHRRSSRLMERQQVAHIHYEDLSLEEEEDISASSGSDQEYHPHHSRESHSLARKTKTQGKDQTSIPLMKGHCSWSSEELLCKEEKREEKQREGDKKGDKEGTRVKGVAIRKGNKEVKGERSTYTSHTHEEEETHSTTQAHRARRSTHIQLKEERKTQSWAKEKKHRCTLIEKDRYTHKHNQIKEERQRHTHNPRRQNGYKHSHTKHTNTSAQDQNTRKRKTTTTSSTGKKGRSYERMWSPWKVWSLPNMLSLLLALLYLGVLITRQDTLLMDILRWCRSGHIPFLSAHLAVNHVLRSYVPCCPIFFKVPRVPSSTTIRKATYQMALLLSLQAVPFPPAGSIIRRLVAVLRLPDETSTMAEEVIALRRLPQHKQETTWEGLAKKEVPAVECQAAAALLVVLKMCCGLNDSSEHHLSFVAERVNGVMMGDALQHPSVCPLFSFDEWMRYIMEVAWLSKQVNPLCEAIAPPPVLARPLETKLMAELARLLTFCNTDPAVSIPDLESYPNMRRQLEALGLPLEKLWQAHFTEMNAAHDPLLGTLEEYVERYSSSSTRHRHQQEPSTRLLKRAQELLQTTFSSTQLFWTQHLHYIQNQLKEHGSSLCLKPIKYPHSLCPLPLKPDERRRHYREAHYRERKHTHSVAAGSTQGRRGVLDERHTMNTTTPVNSSSSCVGAQVKFSPAAGVCRNLQHRQGSLATSERESCHPSSQKSCIRNGKVCHCMNMKRADSKDQYRRDWNCLHTQSMHSWDEQRHNLKDTKYSRMEEQCRKCHIPNLPTKYGKNNNLMERKKSSQGKQHSEGCCHKNTENFPPQNRNIKKSESTHERRCTLIPSEICSHKEEERVSYDNTRAFIIKRNIGTFKGGCFLSDSTLGYVPDAVYKNQAKEECAGFSLLAVEKENRTPARDGDKGYGFLCASEDSRGQRSHVTKHKRRGMNRITNKSTNFLYTPVEKDALSETKYPPGEEGGSQRRNTGTPCTISHSPEDKTGYPWKKREAHPSTPLSPEDKDDSTSSTSSYASSTSSVLAHESLDQLLRDGTSATALSHTLFIPVPAYRMWQGPDITKDRWKQVWSGLPRSYRHVVEVLVALCGVTCRELLEEVQAMEKMVEIYSSLLFLFPNTL